MRSRLALCAIVFGCGGSHLDASVDSNGGSDAGRDSTVQLDAPGVSPLVSSCAVTTTTFAPNPCPPPTSAHGKADFCFRPQWPGVTAVDLYGQFSPGDDWTTPRATLTDDGSGTFIVTGVAVPDGGPYPYLFKATGDTDNVINGPWFEDQTNPLFGGKIAGAPIARSLSNLMVPQPAAATLHHVTGKVVYGAVPQPCFTVSILVGERLSGTKVLSEQSTGNYAETDGNGNFDFPIADGQVQTAVRYPFFLAGKSAPYPDPTTTPSIGIARQTVHLSGADIALDPLDVTFKESDYAAMAPTNGTAPLPTVAAPLTFTIDLIAGAQTGTIAVIGTDIAGNDADYQSKPSTMTSVSWDGSMGMNGTAQTNTPYFWGTWQQLATWNEQSLLFPIEFPSTN